MWKIPFGEFPELAEQGLRNTGSENYGGPVVTAGGVLFIGATSHDRKFCAFDKTNGELLWETLLPAAGNATPAAYEVNGRQFVVIPSGGGKWANPSGDAYVAFALSETTSVRFDQKPQTRNRSRFGAYTDEPCVFHCGRPLVRTWNFIAPLPTGAPTGPVQRAKLACLQTNPTGDREARGIVDQTSVAEDALPILVSCSFLRLSWAGKIIGEASASSRWFLDEREGGMPGPSKQPVGRAVKRNRGGLARGGLHRHRQWPSFLAVVACAAPEDRAQTGDAYKRPVSS